MSTNTTHRFDVEENPHVEVRTASGRLHVVAGDAGVVLVTLSNDASDAEERIAQVECRLSGNRLLIDTRAQRSGGLRATLARLRELSREDVDVELSVPEGTTVVMRTASGNVETLCPLSTLEVHSASGDTRADVVTEGLRVETASGDVRVRRVDGRTDVKGVSGDVTLEEVSGPLEVRTVSGDVDVTCASALSANLQSVSGDVRVAVRRGLLLDIDAQSVSGDMASEIPLDGSPGTASSEESVRVKVRSVSGDVHVGRG